MDIPLHDGFPVAPRSRIEIRGAAVNARRVLALPDGRIDIPAMLDKLSAEFSVHYDVFDHSSAPMPREVEACFVPEDMTIYIRDTVYAEMASGGQRAVFTIGHELGHAVLAHRRSFARASGPVKVFANSEWQANTFAAEFTMPLDQIRSRALLTAQSMATFFGVSPRAATVRLDDLRRKGEL